MPAIIVFGFLDEQRPHAVSGWHSRQKSGEHRSLAGIQVEAGARAAICLRFDAERMAMGSFLYRQVMTFSWGLL